MRVMTKAEDEILRDIIRLAQGDLALVDKALAIADTNEKPSLGDVVEYIKTEVLRRLKAGSGHQQPN